MLVTLRGQMLNQGTFLSYYILVCCGDTTSWFVDIKENNKFDLGVKGLTVTGIYILPTRSSPNKTLRS